MKAYALPPPFRGFRDDVPVAVLESPFAEQIQNYNVDSGRLVARHGDDLWATDATFPTAGNSGTFHLTTYGSGTSQQLFEVAFNDNTNEIKFYDASAAGAPTSVHTLAAGATPSIVSSLFFNNYLFFFGLGSLFGVPQYYNGSAWGAAGYTYPSGFVGPFGGNTYKNRAYIICSGTPMYVYSGIDAISGATKGVNLSTVITAYCPLYAIASVATSEGINQQILQCFILASGEVLAYTGSYPDSADWQIVGRFMIPRPVFYHSIIEVNGDVLVITIGGLVSLRAVLAGAKSGQSVSALSDQIDTRWKELVNLQTGSNVYGVAGIYDQLADRLVIQFPFAASGISSRLVYYFKTQAWVEHLIESDVNCLPVSLTYFKDRGYYLSSRFLTVMNIEGKSDYRDDDPDGSGDYAVTTSLITAPIPTEKYGIVRVTGVEAIQKMGTEWEATYKLIGNFGQNDSATQALPPVPNTNIQKSFINVGTEANYVQLQISGAGATSTGHELYGLNFWTEPGGAR